MLNETGLFKNRVIGHPDEQCCREIVGTRKECATACYALGAFVFIAG